WLVLVACPGATVRIRRVTAALPEVPVAARQDQQANLQKELIQPLVILPGHAAHPEEEPAGASQDGKGRSNAEEKRAPQGDDECAHHDKDQRHDRHTELQCWARGSLEDDFLHMAVGYISRPMRSA